MSRKGEGPFEDEMIGALGVGGIGFDPRFSPTRKEMRAIVPLNPVVLSFCVAIHGLVDEADKNLAK
jgi:hypothetical protein